MPNSYPPVSGYTILAAVSFLAGGLIDRYIYGNDPPVKILLAVLCVLLVLDAIGSIEKKLKDIEGKLNAVLEKSKER